MFDHGRPWPVNYGQFMVNDSRACFGPWSFRGLLTMKGPSFDHGHYMVDDGHGTAD